MTLQTILKALKSFALANLPILIEKARKHLASELAKKALISFLQKYIGSAGLIGLAVRFAVPKLIKFGLVTLKDIEQTVKDEKVAVDFKEEIAKPEVNEKKREELEKDILSGK